MSVIIVVMSLISIFDLVIQTRIEDFSQGGGGGLRFRNVPSEINLCWRFENRVFLHVTDKKARLSVPRCPRLLRVRHWQVDDGYAYSIQYTQT